MIRTRETALAWLASAGCAPEFLHDIFLQEPDPQRILEGFLRSACFPFGIEIPETAMIQLRKNCSEKHLNFWDEVIKREQIHAMTILDEDYPSGLRDLPEAPAILFDQGDRQALKGPSISIVGSRNASYKGIEATGKIAEELSRNGIRIISGLAYGIDAAAHKGCLKGGSPTVAVLGCGLDQDYPRENAGLRREISEKDGLVISEFSPGEKPLGWHFPWRNRIISGLGDALVLMEARIRSGSMTTVQHALNQGRDVFVYPGEPGSIKTEGNHQLLREGAIFFTGAKDILEDMGWLDKTSEMSHNNESSAKPVQEFLPAEKLILEQLDGGELSFDQLCERLKLPASQLGAMISMLQLKGVVRALPGKIFQLVTAN